MRYLFVLVFLLAACGGDYAIYEARANYVCKDKGGFQRFNRIRAMCNNGESIKTERLVIPPEASEYYAKPQEDKKQ